MTASSTGYQFPGATKYVSDVSIASTTGIVTVISTVPNATGALTLTPAETGTNTGQLVWTCASTAIAAKYLPSNCRAP
jgi:type IV pilus assembly protein PilA